MLFPTRSLSRWGREEVVIRHGVQALLRSRSFFLSFPPSLPKYEEAPISFLWLWELSWSERRTSSIIPANGSSRAAVREENSDELELLLDTLGSNMTCSEMIPTFLITQE